MHNCIKYVFPPSDIFFITKERIIQQLTVHALDYAKAFYILLSAPIFFCRLIITVKLLNYYAALTMYTPGLALARAIDHLRHKMADFIM